METPPNRPQAENKEKLKPKVLIAEDRKDIVQMLTFALTMKGCDVEVVGNGVLLVSKLSEKGPGYYHFVISDNNMSGGAGIEAIEKIRKNMGEFRQTPIILYTGDVEPALPQRARSLENVTFIKKTDARDLYNKIDELIKPKPPAA